MAITFLQRPSWLYMGALALGGEGETGNGRPSKVVSRRVVLRDADARNRTNLGHGVGEELQGPRERLAIRRSLREASLRCIRGQLLFLLDSLGRPCRSVVREVSMRSSVCLIAGLLLLDHYCYLGIDARLSSHATQAKNYTRMVQFSIGDAYAIVDKRTGRNSYGGIFWEMLELEKWEPQTFPVFSTRS